MQCKKCGITIIGNAKCCDNCGEKINRTGYRESYDDKIDSYDPEKADCPARRIFIYGIISVCTSIIVIGAVFGVIGFTRGLVEKKVAGRLTRKGIIGFVLSLFGFHFSVAFYGLIYRRFFGV